MSWTDDPERDFERWSAEQERKHELYDMGCVKCAWCKQPIRQYEDPWCYDLYEGEPLHQECKDEMFKRIRNRLAGKQLLLDLFNLMEDAYEDRYEIHTPEPEIGDY